MRQTVLVLAVVSGSALIWLFWGGRNRGLTVDWRRRGKRLHRSGHRETDMAECVDGGSDDRGGGTYVDRTRCVLCRDRALEWNSLVSLGLQSRLRSTKSNSCSTHHQSKREAIDRSRVPGRASDLDGSSGRSLRRSSAPWLRCDGFSAGLVPWIRLVCHRVQTSRNSGPRKSELVYAGTFGILLVLGMQLP